MKESQSRRTVLKKAGGLALSIPIASGTAASAGGSSEASGEPDTNSRSGERSDESREVIYAGENVRLIKLDDQNYVVEGDYTEEQRQAIIDEYVMEHDVSDGVSTQTHSDSGTASTAEEINNDWYFVNSDSWAQADNGDLTFEGTASGSSYYDAMQSYPKTTDRIEVTSTLKGFYEKRVANIVFPGGYTVDYDQATATFTGGSNDTSSHTVHHYEGAVVMTAEDCWYKAAQDDSVQFTIGSSDHILGTYIEMDVGHCWV